MGQGGHASGHSKGTQGQGGHASTHRKGTQGYMRGVGGLDSEWEMLQIEKGCIGVHKRCHMNW